MKVVLVTKTIYPFHLIGGTERFYYNLARFLAREGVDVEVVSSGLDNEFRKVIKGRIRFTFIPPCLANVELARIVHKVFDANVARYLLKRENFDIVHGSAGLYTYAKLKRRPLILHVVELWEFPCCEHPNPFVRTYTYTLDYIDTLIAFRKADRISTEVEAEALEIHKRYKVPWDKIFYLPPGVDLERIEEAIRTVNLTREDLGVADADLVLICVSRLEPNKGVHVLIEALRILNQHLNVKLILVGAGSMEPLINAMIKRYKLEDKVKRFKNTPDNMLYKLYDLADVAVVPTLHEGLPTVLLEAMACGKPVVASRTPEISCVIKNGVNGFLTRPGDPSDIANTILKLHDKRALKQLSNVAKSCGRSFDWRFLVKRLLRVYYALSG